MGGVVEEGVGLGGGIGVSLIQFNQQMPSYQELHTMRLGSKGIK